MLGATGLKMAATLTTLLALAGSAAHVAGHVKNSAAPLHPAVLAAAPTASAGRLTLTPAVRTGSVQPVTSTYVS